MATRVDRASEPSLKSIFPHHPAFGLLLLLLAAFLAVNLKRAPSARWRLERPGDIFMFKKIYELPCAQTKTSRDWA